MGERPRTKRKWCFVPMCRSTGCSTPGKIFVSVPRNIKRRRAWIEAVRRDESERKLSLTSTLWCCEDHFNMEEDMEDFMKFRLTGGTYLKSKKDTVPHIFKCQPQRKAIHNPTFGAIDIENLNRLVSEAFSSTRLVCRNFQSVENSDDEHSEVAATMLLMSSSAPTRVTSPSSSSASHAPTRLRARHKGERKSTEKDCARFSPSPCSNSGHCSSESTKKGYQVTIPGRLVKKYKSEESQKNGQRILDCSTSSLPEQPDAVPNTSMCLFPDINPVLNLLENTCKIEPDDEAVYVKTEPSSPIRTQSCFEMVNASESCIEKMMCSPIITEETDDIGERDPLEFNEDDSHMTEFETVYIKEEMQEET